MSKSSGEKSSGFKFCSKAKAGVNYMGLRPVVLKGRTSKGAFCLPRIISHHDCAFKGALQLCNLPHADRSKNKEMAGPPREFRVMA